MIILFAFHHGGVGPELRYTRVAEGNISKTIYDIWNSGFTGFKRAVKGDALEWGRIRPMQWIIYNVPFFMTMVRNGDLFRSDPNVPVRQRMNGDLQTHIIFLLGSLAIACGAMVYLIFKIGGAWWIALLFPIYLASSQTLSENLLVFYSDSQEIPQILFISLYLIGIYKAFEGKVPNCKQEVFAAICLLFAFGMKETSIILTPFIITIMFLTVLLQKGKSRPFLLFSIRHTAIHLVYSISLLSAVLLFRSGRYVTENYVIKSDIGQLFDFSMDALSKGFPVFHILIIGGIFAVILMWKYQFIGNDGSRPYQKIICLMVLAIGLFLGFWLINIPWRQKLIKYYLPAFFFASFGAVLIQGFIYQTLWKKRLRLAAVIWIVGSCYFLLSDFNLCRTNIMKLYNEHYEYRKMVPLISRDIDLSSSGRTGVCKVYIAAGQLFQERELPFLRHVNLVYKKNIWNNGNIDQHIKACEKNYFRIYPDESSVSITYRENLPDNFEPDILYVINDAINQNQLNIKYRLANGWVIGKPAIIIKKYIRQDQQITGIQS